MPTETRLIQRAYKFALAPTPAQARAFASHAGGARFAYNWGLGQIFTALDARQAQADAGQEPDVKVPGHFDLCKAWTAHKNDPANELGWVGENFVGAYQAALRDADVAWRNFIASKTGARKGRRMGRPRFKSKRRTPPSFQVHGDSLRMVDQSHVNLPKIGPVKVPGKVRVGTWTDRNARTSRALARALRKPAVSCPVCAATGTVVKPGKPDRVLKDGTIKPGSPDQTVTCTTCKGGMTAPAARIIRATISRGASGTWWCSVTAEVAVEVRTGPSRRQQKNGVVGLDLGVRYLAVTSTGDTYTNSRYLDEHLAELRRLNKALARAAKDSKRREKAKRRLGILHEQVALMRKDATDRITTELARTYAVVAVEGWDAQRLAEKGSPGVPVRLRRNRNRALADANPGAVRWQLEYKASWSGSTFHKGEPHWETGRTCSVCGRARTKPVPLAEEQFRCDGGHVLPRRVNSARVMEKVAAGLIVPDGTVDEPRGGDVRPVTPRRDGRSSAKRAARSRQRGKTGTPDP